LPGIDRLAEAAIAFVHNFADLNLVTSPQLKDELAKFGVKRLDVWRKGIDTVRFNPSFKSSEMRSTLTSGHPEAPLIIYVGRLGAEKKLKQLKTVLERFPQTRLAIVGNGPYLEELQQHFEGTNTVFTGALTGDALSNAFASADVFCMPSDSETLGFVILESMASGVPVVGSNAGGIPDVIADGRTGFLARPNDAEDFADKVGILLNDAHLRQNMSVEARIEAEKWDWESATSFLRNIQYRKAIALFR
jgi:sulfoquinovosyltransferase